MSDIEYQDYGYDNLKRWLELVDDNGTHRGRPSPE